MGDAPSALRDRLVATFRWVDPGPHSAALVSDASGWWRDPSLLASLGPALAAPFVEARPSVVVAPEVTGFLLGPLVATALGVGFVEAFTSAGRDQAFADAVCWRSTWTDYRGRTVSVGIRTRHLSTADRVLVVDDWVATGAQLSALRALVEESGATYVGGSVVVAECDPPTAERLGVRALLTAADLAPPSG